MRGRIRSIKPEVHQDEELWDLEVAMGLPIFRGFTGLWSHSDREGRFEWRPRALKSAILPYWDGDFSEVLEALASKGFIRKYTVDGRDYGWVRRLTKHQRFDHREPPSELPAPPWEGAPPCPGAPEPVEPPPTSVPGHAPTLPGHAQESPGHARVEGKGRERNGKGRGREQRASAREPSSSAPDSDRTGPGYTSVPEGWSPSEALYAEAFAQGVPRELLDEDVTYWRARKSLGGEFTDLEGFFRAHFTRLKKHRETETFRRARDNPTEDRLQRQADRIRLLREQEALEGGP